MLVALPLAMLVNIHWLWLAVFVGANLLQSSVTRFCPLEKILGFSLSRKGAKPED